MLGTLALAGLAATAAASGYVVYRAYTATPASTRSTWSGLRMALALFVWSALALPVAGVLLAGGALLAFVVLPLLVALVGVFALSESSAPAADPDVITV